MWFAAGKAIGIIMKNFIYKMGAKLQKFMYGRYGTDQLQKFLTWAYTALIIVFSIVGRHISREVYMVLFALEIVLLVLIMLRPFSKNIARRRAENDRYLKMTANIRAQFKYLSNKIKFRKTHVMKKCPGCKAVLRMKRKSGKHTVICPHCGTRFEIRTLGSAKQMK